MPFDFTDKENVKIIRYHVQDPLAPVTEFSELTAISASAVDGTFYADKQNDFIYIYAKKFSTYAVNYTVTSKGDGVKKFRAHSADERLIAAVAVKFNACIVTVRSWIYLLS